jgi:hypothetical protein
MLKYGEQKVFFCSFCAVENILIFLPCKSEKIKVIFLFFYNLPDFKVIIIKEYYD